MFRVLLAGLVCTVSLFSTNSYAGDNDKFRKRAAHIAMQMQVEFDCTQRGCLKKAVPYGGEKNELPEKYRAMMAEKLSALGGASQKDGRAVAGIIASFVGACTWRPEDCAGVVINSAHRNESGLGSARHTNSFGSRAFDFQGFRDIDHQIRFLTRMALVAEEMGLEPNVGLGASEGVQVTHFDVNGNEVSRKKQCKKRCSCSNRRKGKRCRCKSSCSYKEGAVTWDYGSRNTLQTLFQSEIRKHRIANEFVAQVIGSQSIADNEEFEELPITIMTVTTFYGPGSDSKIEGPWKTYADNLEGVRDSDGDGVPRTLDHVRLGKFSYVTLASAPENLGKFYYMGAVTYQSPIDRKMYTGDKRFAERGSLCEDGAATCTSPVEIIYSANLAHVVGYVHDIGGAFKESKDGEGCTKYNTCGIRLRKFDVAVGDFRGWPGRDTEKFVDNAITQAYGHNAEHAWQRFTWFTSVASAMPVVSIDSTSIE